MTTTLKFILATIFLAAIAAASLFVGYHSIYPTYAVRYRLDVRAVVGGVPRSGTSVIEVLVATQPNLLDNPRWRFRIDGNATFIDLGEGHNLVALLNPGPTNGRGLDAVTIVFRAFQIPFLSDHAADVAKLTGERELAPINWPPFVTFQDVHDPLSVKSIDPMSLQETYGVEARIERVSLSVTGDPVTHDLEQKLPWLNNVPQSTDDPKALAMVKLHLGKSAFTERFP